MLLAIHCNVAIFQRIFHKKTGRFSIVRSSDKTDPISRIASRERTCSSGRLD
jgi:hypothetical protein